MEELIKAPWPGWETVRLIGRGSLGTDYEIKRHQAEGESEPEHCALKVITLPLDPGGIEKMYSRGQDEKGVTAALQTQLGNVVTVYSRMRKMDANANVVSYKDIYYTRHSNKVGWVVYIRTELLTPMLRTLPANITEAETVRIAKDLCGALVQCENNRIRHRNISPQCIFRTAQGTYKLGDTGMAEAVGQSIDANGITARYMAPEVCHDRPYDNRADIYSLGLVLYWLLNERRLPFVPAIGVQDAEAVQRRLSGEKIPAPAHGSEGLRWIVLKACAHDPAQRYASAAAMLEDLEKLTRGIFVIPPVMAAPKVETPKTEAPKVETPKVETPKVEAPKAEPIKAEKTAVVPPVVAAPKVEIPKVETPKMEAPKVEKPKVEAPKAEPVKTEKAAVVPPVVAAPKVEAPKVEKPKVETPKAEPVKTEKAAVVPPVVAAPKVETPKVEKPKVETPKAEPVKTEKTAVVPPVAVAPKVETPKVETPKVEKPKAEEPKAETTKAKTPKAEPSRTETTAKPVPEKKKKKKGLLFLLLLLGLAAIAAAAFFLWKFYGGQGGTGEDPSGAQQLQATDEKTGPTSDSNSRTDDPTDTQPDATSGSTAASEPGLTETVPSQWSDWVDTLPEDVTADQYEILKRKVYSTSTLETTTSTESDTMEGWELYDTVKTYGQYGPWSSWSDKRVSATENRKVETQTRYSYQDRETTTGTSSSKSGWTLYDTTYSYGSYGAWSDWSETAVSESDTREVETKTQYRSRTKTYTSSASPTLDGWILYDSVTNGSSTVYYFYQWGKWTGYRDGVITATGDREVSTRTLYQYRDRSKTATYHFERWSAASAWSATKVTATADRRVSEKTYYRYCDRDTVTTYHFQRWTEPSPYTETAATPSETVRVETKTQYRYKLKTGA